MVYEFTLIAEDSKLPTRVFSEAVTELATTVKSNAIDNTQRIKLIKLIFSDLKRETEEDSFFLAKLPFFNLNWKYSRQDDIDINRLKPWLKNYNPGISDDPTRKLLLTSLKTLVLNESQEKTIAALSTALEELNKNSEKNAILDWNRNRFFKDQLITYNDSGVDYSIEEMKSLIEKSFLEKGYTTQQANIAFKSIWQGSLIGLQTKEGIRLMQPKYYPSNYKSFCQIIENTNGELKFALSLNFPVIESDGKDVNVERCTIIKVSIPKTMEFSYPGTYKGMTVSCRTVLRSNSKEDLNKVIAKIGPKINPFRHFHVEDKKILDAPPTSLFDFRYYQAKKNLNLKLTPIERFILKCSDLLGLVKPLHSEHIRKTEIENLSHLTPDPTPKKAQEEMSKIRYHI